MIVKTGTDLSYYKYKDANVEGAIKLSDYVTKDDVTDMRYMFAYCGNLESVTSYEYTEGTYDFAYSQSYEGTYIDDNIKYSYTHDYYYSYSYSYTQNFSQVKTGYVKNMNHMFANCYNLTTANLAYMNFSDCVDARNMFKNCYALTDVVFGRYAPNILLDVNGMFSGCYNLSYVYVPWELRNEYANIFGQGSLHSYYYRYDWNIEDNLPITYAYSYIHNVEELERYTTFTIPTIGAVILERGLYSYDTVSLSIYGGKDNSYECVYTYTLKVDTKYPTEYSDIPVDITYTTGLSYMSYFCVELTHDDEVLKNFTFEIDNTAGDRYKTFDIYSIYVSDETKEPSEIHTSYCDDWFFSDIHRIKYLNSTTLEYEIVEESAFDDYDNSVILGNKLTPPPGEIEEEDISYVFAYAYPKE